MLFGALRAIPAALALIFAFLSIPAAAQTQPKVVVLGSDSSEVDISSEGEVRHKAANFRYPDHIGDMPLRKVVIYGKGDVSVDYTLRGGGNGDAWITFYVYPVRRSFSEEVADIEQNLIKNSSATRIAPRPARRRRLQTEVAVGSAAIFRGRR